MTMASPTTAFGANLAFVNQSVNSNSYYPNTLTVTLNFVSGPPVTTTVNLSNAADGPDPSGFDFFGVTSANAITSVTFAVPNLDPQYYCDPNVCYNGLSGPQLFVDNVQTATATPEPASLVLLGSGLLGLGGTLRRKFRA
jgi:hypothetical protein